MPGDSDDLKKALYVIRKLQASKGCKKPLKN